MSKRYILLAGLLLASAFGLTLMPEKVDSHQIPAKEFLREIYNPARYLSTHQIAKRLIERDPSIFIIDVRTPGEYEKYTIPGAFNIPLENILEEEWTDYLSQDGLDVVLYSNGDIYADQAWTLIAQQGVKNLYIMKGGINQWFATIIQPVAPPETAPSEAFDLYAFERAACIYFGGASVNVEGSAAPTEKKTAVVRKKKKKAAEGGC
jgi:rhodanese-related sulfurtransferase